MSMTNITMTNTATHVPQDQLELVWSSLSEEDREEALAVALEWADKDETVKRWSYPCAHEIYPGKWFFSIRASLSTPPIGGVDISPILWRDYFNK